MTEVRTITDNEIPAYVAAMLAGFSEHGGPEVAEHMRPGIDTDRTLAAFDGDRVVGTARAFGADMTVPGGGRLPVGAVTNVTVLPTHRRRGLLTEMMRQQLADVVDRGEPLAVLIAAEAPIYGRFGYGPAIWRATVRVDSRAAGWAGPEPQRDVEMTELADLRTVAPDVYEASRAARPGTLRRHDWMWARRLGERAGADELADLGKQFHVVTRDGGRVDGFMRYSIKDHWESMRPMSTVVVHELCTASPAAAAALWRYALTMDWCVAVEAGDRPVDDSLPWLLADLRQVVTTDVTEFVWARVLDVPTALAGRTYGAEDRIVVEVVDPFLPDRGGRFALDGSPDGATCAPTDAAADLTLSARELGASYFGGTPLARAAGAGLVDEHSDGAVARFDRLFVSAPAPWCSTMF